MINTPNLGLNLPNKGISNYDIPLNDNFSKIDNEINKINTRTLNTTTMWQFKLPGGEENFSTPVVATFSDNKKYVITSCYDCFIYCHSLESGILKWKFQTDAPCYGRCAVAYIDDEVYIFGSNHGSIYCLNEQGGLRYIHKNIYDRESSGIISSAGNWYFTDSTKNWVKGSFVRGTQGLNAKVRIISGVASGEEHEISGVDESDHFKIWLYDNWTTIPNGSTYQILPKYESDKYYQHAGSISYEIDGVFNYITSFDGQIVKIRVTDGQIQFRFQTKENIEPFPLLITVNDELRIIFPSLDKFVYCLDRFGNLIFKTELGEGSDAFVGWDESLGLLVSSRNNRVYRIDAITGVILAKSSDSFADIDNRPTVYTKGTSKFIVVGNDNGFVYFMDENLDVVWKYSTGVGINASICIANINGDSEDQILVSDMSGKITILNSCGIEIGQLFARGAIEGTPLYFEDGSLNKYLIISSLEGYLKCVKFN